MSDFPTTYLRQLEGKVQRLETQLDYLTKEVERLSSNQQVAGQILVDRDHQESETERLEQQKRNLAQFL